MTEGKKVVAGVGLRLRLLPLPCCASANIGAVEKSRQRRSRQFSVLTYWKYALRANNGRPLRDAASNTAALLDELF